MIDLVYLDYSATTPVDKRILDQFHQDNLDYFANANSLHKIGLEANQKIEEASQEILKTLNLTNYEVVYTSGASEANNLALKGIAYAKQNYRKHIITSNYEHPSIIVVLSYLAKQGFRIDVVDNDSNGLVDLDKLESLITEETTLVTIGAVNSETGILQDLKRIKTVINKYPNIIFHSDMTQAIGKINCDLSNVDLISFSAHKFYGLKGIGALLVKKGTKLIPLVHGGKSTNDYRSGTPATPLILSLNNALALAYENIEKRQVFIKEIHDYLIEELNKLEDIVFNSNEFSINHIVNVSFLKLVSGYFHEELSQRGIYVSTSTACGSENPISMTVKKLTGSYERAESAIRISISHLTKKAEIDQLIKAYKEIVSL